jgi:PAS domain S-box-containing protein
VESPESVMSTRAPDDGRRSVNEERYRALVEAISTFVWVADPSGDFTGPQLGWEQYTGHGFELHGGSGWIQDVHPGDREHVTDVWNRAVRTKSWFEVEWRCWHGATRRWRQCLTHAVPLFNEDGSIREWVGAVRDIENHLGLGHIFERQWLRQAQLSGGLAFWDWMPSVGEPRWTPETYQIFQVPLGSSQADLDERIHPDDYAEMLAARRRAAASGSLDVTFRIVLPGGEIRWLRRKGSTVPSDHGMRLVGVLIDITEQMELQENLRARTHELETLIDAIPACVWIARDPECRVVTGNRMADEFLRVPMHTNVSPTADPGEGFTNFTAFRSDGTEYPLGDLPMQRVCRTGQPALDEELEFRFPDGRRSTLIGNAVPLFDAAGGVRGCAAVFVDITGLKKAEQDLARANRELLFANEQLSQFNFSASHDLREPLREIALFTDLLQRKYSRNLDPEGERYLQYARRGALRIEALIADFVAYTEAAGCNLTVFQPAESRAALDEALENLSAQIQETGAKIEMGELPPVAADPHLLAQLFQHLLSNAIKYRRDDPPVIQVRASRNGDFWKFAVSDNGIGIDPGYRRHIFGLFKRLHGRDQYEGTGIGLAICLKIVERHGGHIWVESEPGQGSTFYFTLPAAKQSEDRTP